MSTETSSTADVPEQKNNEWEVVLLIDYRELINRKECSAIDVLKWLEDCNVKSEQRSLSVFDYLWIARPKAKKESLELVLGHGAERKEVNDLATSLNTTKAATGLSRSIEQKLKMDNSGVRHKLYLIEGDIQNISFTNRGLGGKKRYTMIARMKKNMEEMKASGYEVKQHKNFSDTMDYLVSHHRHVVDSEVPNGRLANPSSAYQTYNELTKKAKWVTRLASSRKALPPNSLGETKIQKIFKEFPTEELLGEAYRNDSEATFRKLSAMKRAISYANASKLCLTLFGPPVAQRMEVQTTRGSRRQSDHIVTPEANTKKRAYVPHSNKPVYDLTGDDTDMSSARRHLNFDVEPAGQEMSTSIPRRESHQFASPETTDICKQRPGHDQKTVYDLTGDGIDNTSIDG